MYCRPVGCYQQQQHLQPRHSSERSPIQERMPPLQTTFKDATLYGQAYPPQGSPRSAAEEYVEDVPKFRQLPCRTFISVGTCPYRERCVYLHDPRLMSRDAKTKTRKKNKEDIVQDSLFWPVLPYQEVSQRLDSSRLPHVIQRYGVPSPHEDQYRRHDQSVYSMWMHFVTFCGQEVIVNPYENEADMAAYLHPGFRMPPRKLGGPGSGGLFLDETVPVNPFINIPRLNIFQKMSLGEAAGPHSGIYRSITANYRTEGTAHGRQPAGKMQTQSQINTHSGSHPPTHSPHTAAGPAPYAHHTQTPHRLQGSAPRFHEYEREREYGMQSGRPIHHESYGAFSTVDQSLRHTTAYPSQPAYTAYAPHRPEPAPRPFSCFGANGLYNTHTAPSEVSTFPLSVRTAESFCGDIASPVSVSERFSPVPSPGQRDRGAVFGAPRNHHGAAERAQRLREQNSNEESERLQVLQFNQMIRLRTAPSPPAAVTPREAASTSTSTSPVPAISSPLSAASCDEDQMEMSYIDDELQKYLPFWNKQGPQGGEGLETMTSSFHQGEDLNENTLNLSQLILRSLY